MIITMPAVPAGPGTQSVRRGGRCRDLAVRVPAGPAGPVGPARPAGDQVEGEQQDRCADDRGDPGGEVEESLQAVDVEQLGGCPSAEQRPGNADYAGEDKAL